MDDYLNESEFSYSESFSITPITLKEEKISPNYNIEIEYNIEDYPIRCPNCWNIPRLNANFKSNNYFLICDEHHKSVYMSFDNFYQNSNRKLSSLLCHECKKSSENMFRCNDNNLFVCEDCKRNLKTNNFCELKDIDIICAKHNEKFKYYDKYEKRHICEECLKEENENYEENEDLIDIEKYVNYRDTIEKYNKKVIENIKMWNNTIRIVNDWLKKINDKFNEFINSIGNYCLLQQKIVNFLYSKNSYLKYNNNYNIYCNYEAINDEITDNFIRKINEYLNFKYNKNTDICTMSKYLINILEEYNKIEIVIEANNNLKTKEKLSEKIPKSKNDIKLIKDMKKKNIELSSIIKALKSFDKGKYLLLGLKTGEITINEQRGSSFYEKLKIKEFESQINHICERDKNLIRASDEKNKAKIIQIKQDFSGYSVIKNLDFGEDDKIYKIISLPILSYYKNRHFFVIAKNKSLLVYKSNKMPINLDPPALGYHNQVEEFSIVQPSFIQNDSNEKKNEELNFFLENNIPLNYPAVNLLEINEKYLAVACPQGKILYFLNTQRGFIEEQFISDIITNDTCSMKITKGRKELVIANDQGFCTIDINDIKQVRRIRIKHNVLFLDSFGKNTLCFLIKKDEDYLIRQYQFKSGFKEMNKISEVNILNENDIIDFFVLKNKIYYLDQSNKIHYYD